jgi:hypothetical protein
MQVSPDSEECVQMVSNWIGNCVRDHSSCQPLVRSENSFLPTRLLEIGNHESGLEFIRLRLNLELRSEKDVKYLALSHCWGNAIPEIATTTVATLASHLEGISAQNLTSNFKDICLLARKLGLKYVWIDSLCIIQDSMEDWSRESGLMGKVFAHAYCTIGAGWRQSEQRSGFLLDRPRKETAMAVLEDFVVQKDSKWGKVGSINRRVSWALGKRFVVSRRLYD